MAPHPLGTKTVAGGEKSRERIASEFRQGKFQVLLASEVAGEGLDFEHCHVIINYDLPWNPMRVEQRIGRCDRLGQASNKVYIGNLASVTVRSNKEFCHASLRDCKSLSALWANWK